MSDDVDTTEGQQSGEKPSEPLPKAATWLVIGATVLALLSTLNMWVERALLDTDEWVEISDELLADEGLRGPLANYIVDQLFENVAFDEELEERLPDGLDPMAGLISGALRTPATEGVERLLATEGARATWSEINRTTHESLVRVLRDETRSGISITDGVVILELREFVVAVGRDLGISDEALDRIPAEAGSVEIVQSKDLSSVQTLVRAVEVMSVVLFLVVVGLYGLAVYLGKGRRIDVVRLIGISLLAGSGLLLFGLRLATRATANAFDGTPQTNEAAEVVARISTQLLREMAFAGVTIGLVAVGFVVLLGPSKLAVRARERLAPLFLSNPATVWLASGALLLLGLYLLPSEPLESWWRAAIFFLLFGLGLEALRRRLEVEHGHRIVDGEPRSATATADSR